MIILAPYSDRIRIERKEQTTLFLDNIKDKYNIICAKTENPGEYEKFIGDHWSKQDDLVIIEHDIITSKSNLDEIIACKYDICAFNYYLYPCATGLNEPVLAHRKVNKNREFVWIDKDDEFADLVGFGLVKISLNVQKQIDLRNIINNADKRKYINYTKSLELVNQSAGITADNEISLEFVKIRQRIHIHRQILKHNHTEN